MVGRPWMARGMTVLSATAGLLAFAFVGFFGTYVTTFDPTLRLVAALAYALPLVGAALVAIALRPHPLDLVVLGLLSAYAIVSVLSADPTASLETLALVASYGSLFLVLLRVGPGALRQGLVIGCAFAATAWLGFSAVRWLQEAVAWMTLDGTMPPLTARSGNLWLSTDAVAALALLAAPYYLAIERTSVRRVLLAVTVASAAVVIPLSGGRVEWVAILVAVLLYAVVTNATAWRRAIRPLAFVVAAAALAAGGLFVTGQLGSLSGRTYIWNSALAVIGAHPLDGSGPGTFSWVRLSETPELLTRYPVYHAHNLVLQVLADGGMLLAAALGATGIMYVRHVVRGGAFTRAQAAYVASLAGFVLILLMDELTQLPALTALFLGSAAFLAHDRGLPIVSARVGPRGALAAAGWLALVLLAVPATLGAHHARVAAAEGRERAIAGDWEAAERAFAEAAAAWPLRASYELGIGLASAHLGHTEQALAHYRRAQMLSPGDPRAPGAIGILSSSPAERIQALDRASRLGSLDPQYAYRLAFELLESGDAAAAQAALGRAALLDTQLLVAPDVGAGGFDVKAVAGATREAFDEEAAKAALDRGTVEAGIELALGDSSGGHPTFAAVGLARSGDIAAAQARLEEILRADPRDRLTRLAARAVSQLACDEEADARHGRLLSLLPDGFSALYYFGPEPRETRDHIYRELGLGDYQPPQARPLPIYPHEWPAGYLPPADCT